MMSISWALDDARRIVDWDDAGRLADDEWLVERNDAAIIAIARAFLSISASERGLREALEDARLALEAAKIWLFDDSGTPIADETTLVMVNDSLAALSPKGEDTQARSPSAHSAPTPTSTKDTTNA